MQKFVHRCFFLCLITPQTWGTIRDPICEHTLKVGQSLRLFWPRSKIPHLYTRGLPMRIRQGGGFLFQQKRFARRGKPQGNTRLKIGVRTVDFWFHAFNLAGTRDGPMDAVQPTHGRSPHPLILHFQTNQIWEEFEHEKFIGNLGSRLFGLDPRSRLEQGFFKCSDPGPQKASKLDKMKVCVGLDLRSKQKILSGVLDPGHPTEVSRCSLESWMQPQTPFKFVTHLESSFMEGLQCERTMLWTNVGQFLMWLQEYRSMLFEAWLGSVRACLKSHAWS